MSSHYFIHLHFILRLESGHHNSVVRGRRGDIERLFRDGFTSQRLLTIKKMNCDLIQETYDDELNHEDYE